jgi:hypothetical protein
VLKEFKGEVRIDPMFDGESKKDILALFDAVIRKLQMDKEDFRELEGLVQIVITRKAQEDA